MKPMDTIQDLIEEAKLRTVWWGLCIFAVTYFLSHTSSSMWINLPISILLASALRILANEVEFYWKPRNSVRPRSYLSHLEKKQLSVNDSRLSSAPPPSRWRRKIDSSVVEASVNDFIDKIMKDFVVDLWYSEITPDKEAPELIRAVIMDALGEISGRVKEINLADLLTRDILDLVGDHLDLFRRNQAAIGVDVMKILSTEERDERLKYHLMETKELHPALISSESEYKVLQRIMAGVLAVVLRSREAQCPLVRTIAREIVTCLVMQPVMNLASPLYINEVIEYILLAIIDNDPKDTGSDQTAGVANSGPSVSRKSSSVNPSSHITSTKNEIRKDISVDDGVDSSYSPPQADWGRVLEAATQRRTEVLTPENLENMWTKGRNYKKKENKIAKKAGSRKAKSKGSSINIPEFSSSMGKESPAAGTVIPTKTDGKVAGCLTPQASLDNALINEKKNEKHLIAGQSSDYFAGVYTVDAFESTIKWSMNENVGKLKRSNSTSALRDQPEKKRALEPEHGGSIISEYYSADFTGLISDPTVKVIPDKVLRTDSINVPKLRSRVMGAYFEKLGSKSFAVYSIAVTDADNRTWFVKRRYSNFEKLHRHLKDIPNYNLHLPPKRIFSSSTEDAFVHERCIQLDKYLQDLLSIANVAEQHEVWDFLSASSKIYYAGKSSSVMRTLAVNVDDAVDDIVRQFKGASGGLMRKVVGSRSLIGNTSSLNYSGDFTWNGDETSKPVSRQDTMGTENSSSDNEEGHQQENFDQEDVGPSAHASGWHSDKEVGSRTFPRRVIKRDEMSKSLNLKKNDDYLTKSDGSNRGQPLAPSSTISSTRLEDPVGMPPEWSPPNVSVPLLNLVDKVFQLKRRGWLRRQVFWISKQIVQLIMEDAIDDWLLRQIYWLRREDTIAFGIRWLQDVLWPNGTFFTRIGVAQTKPDESQHNLNSFQLDQSGVSSEASKQSSFEEQLEASRRADYIRKTLFDGVPTALVSLIGQKQYKRCARDIFYFTQSTICIKQLAYAILELILVTVFPELRDLLRELHGKLPVPAPA